MYLPPEEKAKKKGPKSGRKTKAPRLTLPLRTVHDLAVIQTICNEQRRIGAGG